MWKIERAARLIERNLAGRLGGYDRKTRDATRGHCRAAARALRDLKRQIALPTPGSWDEVEAALGHAFTRLVNGDLGDMKTSEVPPQDRQPVSPWSRAAAFGRALLAAATPLATVLLLQPTLRLAPDHYYWAKLITTGWAVVYLLIFIDPALREKIKVFRDLVLLALGGGRGESNGQPPNKGFLAKGTYSKQLSCTPGAPIDWTATAMPSGELAFQKGYAEAATQASGFDTDYGQNVTVSDTTVVRLTKVK
jgi:hypothetical protein